MNQKQKENWEITRTKGIWRYVLVQWLLKSMLPGFLAYLLAQYLGLFHSKMEMEDLFFMIPFFLLFGIFTGLLVWGWNETMYK